MEAVSSFSDELFRSSCSPYLKRGCCRRYHNAFWARNWLECHQHRFLLSRCLTHYNKKSKLQQKSDKNEVIVPVFYFGCGLTIDNLRSLWTGENAYVNHFDTTCCVCHWNNCEHFFLVVPLHAPTINVTDFSDWKILSSSTWKRRFFY